MDVASTSGLLSPHIVADVLVGRVSKGEDGSTIVLDESGRPMTNGIGDPLSVSDLVASFAKSNPHFVPASPHTGPGSRPGGAGAPPANGPIDKSDIQSVRANAARLRAEFSQNAG